MACCIFSNMYPRGMPFSFSMSSTAAKNSAFILTAPLYHIVTLSRTWAT